MLVHSEHKHTAFTALALPFKMVVIGASGLQLRVRDFVRKLRPERFSWQLRHLLTSVDWPPSPPSTKSRLQVWSLLYNPFTRVQFLYFLSASNHIYKVVKKRVGSQEDSANGAPVRKKKCNSFFQDMFLEWEYNLYALSRPN